MFSFTFNKMIINFTQSCCYEDSLIIFGGTVPSEHTVYTVMQKSLQLSFSLNYQLFDITTIVHCILLLFTQHYKLK